ncbi:MAG TPA: DUF5916 domain-containing protein [Gemmatimonadaceae bacterium]|nr:DUF5916 domain-containing protein [Gemmatimonadaceae bacterium]
MPPCLAIGTRRLVAAAMLLAAPVAALAAQDTEPLALPRLASPITLDGVPDEPSWQLAPPLPLTMYSPVFGGTPTQRTEIRVAYDDEHLWIAGWFHDTDASGIRINSLYRDRWNGDDALAVYVDAFNDKQNAKWFGTTPGGIRFDQLISDDGATLNASWDGFWASRTTVTDSGWFAEVRIPFSTLGFRAADDGTVVMGLTVTRLISRNQERVTFPAIDPAFEFRRPSVAREVVLRNVRTRRPLYVTPYALAGAARNALLEEGTVVRMARASSREAGVDVRYPLSSRLTLDLTYNTDFAQVEADDQQVNLDRFPLFFPERRRFFQEGSGVFDFTTGGTTRVFHSRRIGLTPDFRPLPVLGGARLVGRVGAWDVGLLDMRTRAFGEHAAEHFGVVRLRRPVLNQWSTAGLMATAYDGGERRNVVVAGDGSFRVRGDDYLTLKWAGSMDDADPDGVALIDRSHLYAKLERRTGRGLAYTLSFSRSGSEYRPELGFLARRDFTSANVLANWYRFTDSHPVFRRVWPGMLAFSTFRNADGVLESGQYAVWLQWETKAGGGGFIEPKLFHENVVTPFPIGDALIPAGSYDFADLQLVLHMPAGARLRAFVDARAGTYFDGTRAQAIVTPTWNLSRHLELGGDYQFTALRFRRRDQATDIHLARLRVRTALDARMSANAFVQYNSTSDRLDVNFRLRYAFAEGTDLWLVYNEGLDTEPTRAPGWEGAPRSLARAFILKYSHTFGF